MFGGTVLIAVKILCQHLFFCPVTWWSERESNPNVPRAGLDHLKQESNLIVSRHPIVWRKAEESNPIPVKRTWFSRPVAGPSPLHYFPLLSGPSTRIRTLDPLLPKQVRYQTALHSDCCFSLYLTRNSIDGIFYPVVWCTLQGSNLLLRFFRPPL